MKVGRYKCLSCEPPNCEQESLCIDAIQCWKSKAKNSDGFESISRGCTTNAQQLKYCGPTKLITFPNSNQTPIKHSGGQYAIDCCAGDYCNNGSFPALPLVYKDDISNVHGQYNYLAKLFLAVLGPVFILGVLTVIAVRYMRRRYRKRSSIVRSSYDLNGYPGDVLLAPPVIGDSTFREYREQSVTSGSGFGLPLLVQRSLGRQISIVELIGKGKYGEVWRGIFQGESVAVKIFLSKDEASWARETEIYAMLTWHPNILDYIGSDIISRNSFTQNWLVTHYHALGSLYDYLNRKTVGYKEMIKLCYTMVSGIEHLHCEELTFQKNKVAIAHRDIKSKNMLVKLNGECAIADFGLAVTHTPVTGETVIAPNSRVGTKRYMAPEILDETININSFESFKRADIYSLGLVFWEVCCRTLSNGIAEDYKPPFFDCVSMDPSFEDMHKVVCIDQRRPILPNRWVSDPIMNEMVKLMRESWHQKSCARLSALRIQKTITKITQRPGLKMDVV